MSQFLFNYLYVRFDRTLLSVTTVVRVYYVSIRWMFTGVPCPYVEKFETDMSLMPF